MVAEISVAFLSFLTVFLANAVRYSLRAGVLLLPFTEPVSRKEAPRKFGLALVLTSLASAACLATICSFVWKILH